MSLSRGVSRPWLVAAAVAFLALSGAAVATAGTSGGGSRARPPAVRTLSAEGINEAEALLVGKVYPRGAVTVFWFQWGLTKQYGYETPVSEEEVGPSFGPEEVEEALGELKPGTLYHFRIVARNRAGRTFGDDKAFRTRRER